VSLFSRWNRKKGDPSGGAVVVIRTAEAAGHLRAPTDPNFAIERMEEPCPRCGRPLTEAFITTGGEGCDPDLWRDHPVAVDGWACAGCGVFRYPRRVDPRRIHELTEEGVRLGRAGDFARSELCFARVAWNWPGFVHGHLNCAAATRTRLEMTKPQDPALVRRLVQRIGDQYEAATTAFEADPLPAFSAGAAHAYLALARMAIESRANDRARRMLGRCLAIEGLDPRAQTEARDYLRYLDEGHDRLEEAKEALWPYLSFQDRGGREISTGDDRKRVVDAMATLAELSSRTPALWQATWLRAKAHVALGEVELALAELRAGHARHPGAEPITKDLSLLLLLRDEVREAREVNRASAAVEPTAANLCNLALTELLCGDLDAAEQALARCERLDPTDPVAKAMRSRLAACRRSGAPLPKTLAELQRG